MLLILVVLLRFVCLSATLPGVNGDDDVDMRKAHDHYIYICMYFGSWNSSSWIRIGRLRGREPSVLVAVLVLLRVSLGLVRGGCNERYGRDNRNCLLTNVIGEVYISPRSYR